MKIELFCQLAYLVAQAYHPWAADTEPDQLMMISFSL
jgi:hypothetical protein